MSIQDISLADRFDVTKRHVLLNGTQALVRLTLMQAARALYEELGFVEIPPYYYNPHAGTHYLMLAL